MKNLTAPLLFACSALLACCGINTSAVNRAAPDPTPATEAAIAVPIRAGQTANWRAALRDLTGPRYEQYKDSRTRFGLSSQITFLQSTPMGDFALIHMTGSDVHQAFHEMSESPTAWDADWREMIQELHGVGFEGEANIIPTFEELLTVTADFDESQHKLFLFMVPLAAGTDSVVRERVAMAVGEEAVRYSVALNALGVSKESMYLQSTPIGQALIIRWYCSDAKSAVDELFKSGGPLPQWLDDSQVNLSAVPLALLQPIVRSNELIGVYPNPQRK